MWVPVSFAYGLADLTLLVSPTTFYPALYTLSKDKYIPIIVMNMMVVFHSLDVFELLNLPFDKIISVVYGIQKYLNVIKY